MAKLKPTLPQGWGIENFILAQIITEKANILVLESDDYERLSQLKQALNLQITILNDDIDELKKAYDNGFEIINGSINDDVFFNLKNNAFDFIIGENIIAYTRYPYDFLKNAIRVAGNVILSNKNKGRFKHRVKFLFSGSHFVTNQYEIFPDDKHAWFNRHPWWLSHKDIVNLCACQNLTIKQGVMIYKNGTINNMYDIRSYPNMNAERGYYLITNDNTGSPSYIIGGSAI